MREELLWYVSRKEEVTLVGTFYGYDKGFPFFKYLTNTQTEEETYDIHIRPKEMEVCDKLKFGKTYVIRGYVVWYKRINGTKDLRIDEAIIERI